MPRALLFDLGGVLLDVDSQRSLAHWARAAGVPLARLAGRYDHDDAYRAFECGQCDAAAFFDALARQLAIDLPERDWLAGWNAMLGELRPAIGGLVTALAADWPLYLFSNTNAAHEAHWAPRCEPLLRHFRACYLSHRLGARKPDAAAFAKVVERIGIAADRILFFDDLPANVAGARAAGLQAEIVADADGLRGALAAHGIAVPGNDRPMIGTG
jgi:HAD superfamily hydrolase (TIGR01509 family)